MRMPTAFLIVESTLDDLRQTPIPAGLRALDWRAQRDHRGRGQLPEALVDAERVRNVIETQQRGQRLSINRGVEAGEALNGLQFGGEHERFAHPAVVERLFTETVATEMQNTLLLVPHREGEHAIEAFCGFHYAPLAKRSEHDLRVGVTTPVVAEWFEFGTEVLEVVHLAVEHDDETSVRAGHRLMTERREVEDGEASMPQGEAAFRIHPRA
jgi:hypothetical protein